MAHSPSGDQLLSRRSQVEPFHAMDILAQANIRRNEGADIAYLCVGQPAASAPKSARDAVCELLRSGSIGYTDAGGRQDLRRAIATHNKTSYGVDIDPDRIFVTTGSSAGFNLAFLSLFNPGDRVAIASPGYPAYRNILKALSLEVVEIETSAEDRWAITLESLTKIHKEGHLNGILVASPANPTGTMMKPETLKALVNTSRELGIRFISDEIYHGLTYGTETGINETTALEFDDDVIVINSFSKYFCMTGWRIGWMVLPPNMVRPIERLAQSLYISPPEISQVAALHALGSLEELEKIKEGYEINRRLLLNRLPELGFDNIAPIDGAFYAYAEATRHTNDTMEFAKRMLAEADVAATPGLDFDQERGHRFMRFSFAGDHATMVTALDRIEDWLK